MKRLEFFTVNVENYHLIKSNHAKFPIFLRKPGEFWKQTRIPPNQIVLVKDIFERTSCGCTLNNFDFMGSNKIQIEPVSASLNRRVDTQALPP